MLCSASWWFLFAVRSLAKSVSYVLFFNAGTSPNKQPSKFDFCLNVMMCNFPVAQQCGAWGALAKRKEGELLGISCCY